MAKNDFVAQLERINKARKFMQEGVDSGYIIDPKFGGRDIARTAKDIAVGVGPRGLDNLLFPASLPYDAYQMAKGSDKKFINFGNLANKKIDELTGGYTAPQSSLEKATSEGFQEAAGLLMPGAALGKVLNKTLARKGFVKKHRGLNFVNSIFEPTLANLGGTATGAGAIKYYNEMNDDPKLHTSLGLGLVGGIGGSLSGTALKNTLKLGEDVLRSISWKDPSRVFKDPLTRIIAENIGYDVNKSKRLKELGIPESVSTVSNSKMPKLVESAFSKYISSSGLLEKFYKLRDKAIFKNFGLDDVAPYEIPGIIDHSIASASALNLKAQKKNLYNQLMGEGSEHVKMLKDTYYPVNMEPALDLLGEMQRGIPKDKESVKQASKTASGAVLQQIEKLIGSTKKSGLPNKYVVDNLNVPKKQINIDAVTYQKWLDSDQKTPIEDFVKGYTSNKTTKTLPFASVDQKRSLIGKDKSKAIYGSDEHRELGWIYNILSEVKYNAIVDSAIKAGKTEILDSIKNGRKMYAEWANGLKPAADKIISNAKKNGDHSSFKKIFSNNPKYFQAVLEGTAKEQKNDLLTSIIGFSGMRDGNFNPTTAVKNISTFMKQNKNKWGELFKDEHHKNNFSKFINLLSEDAALLKSVENTSGTSPISKLFDLTKETSNNVSKGISGNVVAAVTGILGTAIELLGAKKVAEMMVDPVFLARMNRVMTSKSPSSLRNSTNILFKTPTMKQMFKNASRGSFMSAYKNQINNGKNNEFDYVKDYLP